MRIRLPESPTVKRAAAVAALAGVIALALPLAANGQAATPPSGFPAAGPVVWPSVTVRKAPRASARRVTVLRELRSDYRPQIVLALALRRVGAAPGTQAALTLPNTAGAAALALTARQAGADGNVYHVSVRDTATAGTDVFTVYAGGSKLIEFSYHETDLASLAGVINGSSAPISATALANGPLSVPDYPALAGGRDPNPGQIWYKLNLPIRPFGRTGWVPGYAVELKRTTKRVVVHRAGKVLDVFRNGRRIYRTRVAVGRPDRKTPLGSFYIAAKYVPHRNALVSTYALELSAPAGLPDFLRGGVVGIHGTPATYTIGKAASNGCIRVRPSAAVMLKRIVPLGTPVRVVR
jgi:lipoprotein-anchoring transpeptidase ErfK/SrfK